MNYKLVDTVVLDRDLPQLGLRRGDLGAIVRLHDTNAMKVKFVMASGKTQALVTLRSREVRPVHDDDIVSVRPVA